MSIKLRDGEVIKIEAQFHWSAFIFSKFLAGWGVLVFLGQSLVAMVNEEGFQAITSGAILALLLCAPFGYQWLQNKFKKFIVTDQRIYIETGVLSRIKNDLPLNKVNDVSLRQGILQRLFGSGSIFVLMGNDTPTIIPDLDQPDQFKDAISEMIGNRSA